MLSDQITPLSNEYDGVEYTFLTCQRVYQVRLAFTASASSLCRASWKPRLTNRKDHEHIFVLLKFALSSQNSNQNTNTISLNLGYLIIFVSPRLHLSLSTFFVQPSSFFLPPGFSVSHHSALVVQVAAADTVSPFNHRSRRPQSQPTSSSPGTTTSSPYEMGTAVPDPGYIAAYNSTSKILQITMVFGYDCKGLNERILQSHAEYARRGGYGNPSKKIVR